MLIFFTTEKSPASTSHLPKTGSKYWLNDTEPRTCPQNDQNELAQPGSALGNLVIPSYCLRAAYFKRD